MSTAIAFIYIAVIYIALPIMIIWGWIRWAMRRRLRTAYSRLSLIGFALSTLSALLAIGSVLYALAIHGFRYYDPTLLRIYRWGIVLSGGGLVFAGLGMWRWSVLRWHAFISAMGTLLFWFGTAMGE